MGKVQQKCVGGGCGEKKNTRYVMVVDRGKINKRKNEGERRSWRWRVEGHERSLQDGQRCCFPRGGSCLTSVVTF